MDLLDELLGDDGDGSMRARLQSELAHPSVGSRELTFNTFDAELDWETSTARVFDVLEAERCSTMSLHDFAQRLGPA